MMLLAVTVTSLLFGLVVGQVISVPERCGPCNRKLCGVSRDCPAGMALDGCLCCMVCARSEGESCDLQGTPYYGSCGHSLSCKPEEEYDPDYPVYEGRCECHDTKRQCGSDGVSYPTSCAISAALARNSTIHALYDGFCHEKPTILDTVTHFWLEAGEEATVECRVSGHPAPVVEWTRRRLGREAAVLPDGDWDISVVSRGVIPGQNATAISWLQLLDPKSEDEGDYACTARNSHGSATRVTRVFVKPDRQYSELVGTDRRKDKYRKFQYRIIGE